MADYTTYRRSHQQLHEVDKLNRAQIVQQFALHAQTVSFWLEERVFRPRRTPPRSSKLDPFKPLTRRPASRHTGKFLPRLTVIPT